MQGEISNIKEYFAGCSENELNRRAMCEEFKRYVGEMVTAFVQNYNRPVTGRLIDVSGEFLHLKHRDGRISLVRANAITFLAEVPKKE
jgi:hypothetical protein